MRPSWIAGLWCVAFAATPVAAQSALEFTYGAWAPDTFAVTWSVGYVAPLPGPFDYGVGLTHVDDRRSVFNRTLTGGELSLGVGRDGSGPYLVGSVGLGMKHQDGGFDTHWSAGGGVATRLLPFLSVGIEGRFRAEDQSTRGFWRLDAADRTGFALAGRFAIVWGRGSRRGPPSVVPVSRPRPAEVERAARDRGMSGAGSELAGRVVSTALDAMGSPYRWGGEGAGGYDCSGLIQYAYGSHGIIIPRTSREQARLGVHVEPRIPALTPGDILGFAVEGQGGSITHVGLYVGEGNFIHSASSGVKVSSLTATDPDSQWWRQRWVAARRILR